MGRKTEFKGMTKRAQRLLRAEEELEVDFKRSISDLDSEDIVAFANSDNGGAILIGVEESVASDGRRIGRIVGCQTNEESRRRIYDKASNCSPPIKLFVFVENTKSCPFLRVEIPPGRNKPYSTGGGTYKVRRDGYNQALLPNMLLQMFFELESSRFIERFKQATQNLDELIEQLQAEVRERMSYISNVVEVWIEEIKSLFMEVGGAIEEAAAWAEDAQYTASVTSNEIMEELAEVDRRVQEMEIRIISILEKLGISDPVIQAKEQAFRKHIEFLYKQGVRGETLREEGMKLAVKLGIFAYPSYKNPAWYNWLDDIVAELSG